MTAALIVVAGKALVPLPHRPHPSSDSQLASVAAGTPTEHGPGPMPSTVDGAVADGAAVDLAATDTAGEVAPAPATAEAAPTREAPAPWPNDASSQTANGDAQAGDKDIARVAWRANWPEIRVLPTRASLYIPIKGSAVGATYRFFPKTRVVAIALPRAASLNTLHFYRLAQGGFRTLWTFQDEKNPVPDNGCKLRIKLDDGVLPQVELHDDFVKVTIPRVKGDQ